MYKQIMVPVDLAHADHLTKALQTAADLSRHFGAPICYVGVTASAPGAVAHNPEEYAQKLDAFAQDQAIKHGHAATSKSMVTPDPVSDVDDALIRAVDEVGADLVVMATHLPNLADHLWPSNGGKVAQHTAVSVMLVRDA